MIQAWRIIDRRFAARAFTGDGAEMYGGRWNSRGVPMVYCAGSLAMAALEMLVHLTAGDVLGEYMETAASIDDDMVRDVVSLPSNWRASPAPAQLQVIGDAWARGLTSVALRVPSTIIPSESNYLLNPRHRDFPRIRIGKMTRFKFDPRLKS